MALFERIDFLGFKEARIRLTDEAVAHGFAAAIPDRLDVLLGMVGARGLEPMQRPDPS